MAGAGATMPREPLHTAPAAREDDATLVERAKRDRQAFAPLYARYADPIYRYCYRRLGSQEVAADATSQVFAKAIAALPNCRSEAFRSWLFSIAHNVLIDSFRGDRDDQPLEAAALVPDVTPSPEDQALAAEQRREIVALLGHLLPEQRRVVELRLAGLNGNEIGEVLGRSRASVDTIQFRAMARLRSVLGVADPVKGKGGRDGRG